MADKFMYIPKDLKRLDNQPNKPTNQNTIKVPKVVKPTNKKLLL